MKETFYESFGITYLTPIITDLAEELGYEEFSFAEPVDEEIIDQIMESLAAVGGVAIQVTEGLMYLRDSNIVSIIFREVA